MAKDILFLAVTADKYELPLVVEDSAARLAKKLDIMQCVVYESIRRNYDGSRSGYRIVKVDVEE